MTHGTGGTVSPTSGVEKQWIDRLDQCNTNNNSGKYSFSGWTGSGTGSYSGTNNPASITMNGPITETAAFTQNPVQVTVQTNPAGLSFSVDGTTYTAAQTFSWQPGSSHTIATTSPQSGDTGVRYVWMNWSGGGAISHTVAPTTNKTYTAKFSDTILPDDEPRNWWHCESGQRVEKQRSSCFDQCYAELVATVSPIGLGADRLVFRNKQSGFNHNGRTDHWRQRLSLIIDRHVPPNV